MLSKLLARSYQRNQWVIQEHAKGISHEQSLSQTEYNVNCLNWVVGHIVSSRCELLERVFGVDPVMTPAQLERYSRESDPVLEDGPDVIPFDELLGMLDATEEALESALAGADDSFLAEETPVGEDRTASRGAQVMFTYFHDTYHAGQTDLLRQMSGMNDKII